MITTAVILARGLGTRMRAEGESTSLSAEQAAAASLGYKALMPIGAHRLIDYSLSALADAGITRAVVVVAPEHEAFSAHVRELAPSRLRIDFAVQARPPGRLVRETVPVRAFRVCRAPTCVDYPCLVLASQL